MPLLNNYLTHRSTTDLTVADIFRAHWDDYRRNNGVTPDQARVAGAIMACRTPQLGGRIDQCNECGALVFRFNSCRDRHCNQCQKYERAKWVEKQKVSQLSIPYFHIVFTTDHGLNPLFEQHPRLMYDLLFQTASQVLQQKAGEDLGCEVGITAVLHTWGQTMQRHVHLHTMVTGGGLSLEGRRWVKPKSPRYLVDGVALSAAYRDKLLSGIERLYRQGQLSLTGAAAELDVLGLLGEVRQKEWEVFIRPFENPDKVSDYLSR
jgi:Transposase zinc-binding domain/Putative transposase